MKAQKSSIRVYFFLLLLFAFAAAIIGDNAAEALLLSQYDAVIVSRLFSVNALALFLFSIFSMAVVDKFNRAKLAALFIFLLMGIITLSWFLLIFGFQWVYFLVYTVAYTGKIFLFFFVWTLANDVADSRSGAKDFPVIAAGGTIGAIATTFLIPHILHYFDPLSLLLLWLVPLTISLVFVFVIYKKKGEFFKRRRFGRKVILHPRALLKNVAILRSEPVLRNMSVAYFLLFFLIFVQQYYFYDALEKRFTEARDISRFLGYFYGVSMLSTLFLQITIAGKITRVLGIIRTLFVQPIIMGVAFLLLATTYTSNVSPLFYFQVVVAGVGLRIAFMDSFFSPNYQNFFSTLPHSIRGQSKLAIEGVVKPLAMVGASLWVAVVPTTGWSIIPLVGIALVAGITLYKMKESFIATLVHYLAGYHSSKKRVLGEQAKWLQSDVGDEVLKKVFLEGSVEVQIFVAQLLGELGTDSAIKQLRDWYLQTDYDPLKREILILFSKTGRSSLAPFLYEQISSSNPSLASASLRTIAQLQVIEPARIRPYLHDTSTKIQAVAFEVLSQKIELNEQEYLSFFEKLLFSKAINKQGHALSSLARMKATDGLELLLFDYWNKNEKLLIQHKELFRYFLQVVRVYRNWVLLAQLLDILGKLSERNYQLLIETLVEICHEGEGLELLSLRSTISYLGSCAVIEAVGRSGMNLSREIITLLEKDLERELEKYQDALDSVVLLRSQPQRPRLQLLADALEREELVLHARNCMWLSAILDKSKRIAELIDRVSISQKEVQAQMLEVVDTLGNPLIRRTFRILFNDISVHSELVDYLTLSRIYVSYQKSEIPIIRLCAEYANERKRERK